MGIRSFDPSKVQREHIKPLTLVWGADTVGIDLRIDRFAELLIENGDEPSIFATAEEALPYVMSGDMFRDNITVVIRDVSDMARSTPASKKIRSPFLKALATYDESSVFVFGLKGDYACNKEIISYFSTHGGVVREVSAPHDNETRCWIAEYCASTGCQLSQQAMDAVLVACTKKELKNTVYDLEVVQAAIDFIGEELEGMSPDDIKEWLITSQQVWSSDIIATINKQDPVAFEHMLKRMEETPSLRIPSLLRIEGAMTEIVCAAECRDDLEQLRQYKNALIPKSGYYARETVAQVKHPIAYYRKVLAEVSNEISRSMGSNISGQYMDLLLAIGDCTTPRI